MDNQHKMIKGYRDLSESEITAMNALKDTEAEMGKVLAELEAYNNSVDDKEANRWVAIARTHLETGFMFALKAVAKPTNGLGRR